MNGAADAQILDRGYRAYDGPRTGVKGAMWTVTKHSIQRALGLKRRHTAKIMPFLSIGFAFIPAIVFVGFVALAKDVVLRNDILPSYANYYGFVIAAIFIFAAFVAPEVLCPDRRSGLLGLYLASPLSRDTYLLAKAAAVAIVLSIVTIGPLLLMLIAYTILGSGPDGFAEWIKTFLRIIAGGFTVSLLYTSLSLAVSSTTTRKAAASAVIIITLVGSAIVAGSLVFGADQSKYFWLINLLRLPIDSVRRIFGEHIREPDRKLDDIPTAVTLGCNYALSAAMAAFVWWRYRKLAVTR